MASNIQPNPQNTSNSLTIPQNAQELVNYYRIAPHKGAQIEMFFAFAENYPQIAIPAFCSILENNADLPMRALAIQSFAKIAGQYHQIKQDIEVLRYLANEAKGSGKVTSDLTRWAGAWALDVVGFPHDAIAHLDGGAMTENPSRIRNEMVANKLHEIDRIKRLDPTKRPTAEYERLLEFFIYGAETTQDLFQANITNRQYEDIIYDIIYQLNVRGVELALDPQHDSKPQIAMTALDIAKQLFLENQNEAYQRRLLNTIARFLNNDFKSISDYDTIRLRKNAAEAIINIGNWLHPYLRARALVICERWDQVVKFGEDAVKSLEDVLERRLLLSPQETHYDIMIKALETVDKISFNSFDKKEDIITRTLLDKADQLRIRGAEILRQYQQQLNPDLINLVDCILCENKIEKFDLKDATIQKIEAEKYQIQNCKDKIDNNFSRAINYSNFLSNKYQKLPDSDFLRKFLSNKRNRYINDLKNWVLDLNQKHIEKLEGINKNKKNNGYF
jgi:hypothetical protein